ncbi:hypothetical protein PF011_g13956 [Phytophthora fragariae]|uniref:U2 snRNP-associated SURP motif-containing protein n=1 Tax=Phytophthora fragariae TaxID=53985 RepID=A0A6A3K1K2_9STRA|nr:hypothetical protein PF011_g13956 [Phytophthora fragariae]
MGRRRPSRSEEDAAPPAERQPQPQLPWGMEKTEMQPSSLTALTDDKLARFVLGHQKKTKFQKEREDREAKKRQADEEAAKIYATFVASFDNEDETKGKAFVRGGAQESGDVYRLRPNEPPPVSKKVPEVDTRVQEVKHRDVEQLQKPRKRRAIDEFLEEMKERGPAPVAMDGAAMTKGSFDTGDPETTNLYVGNLAPTVTEELLEKEFGRYGDVYSVKIMWPRSEEERARRRNCGFVSFYERRDADDARVNLDNKELEGQPIIVGWGKAVKIQPRARAPGVLLPAAVTPTSITAPTIPSADVYTVGTQTIAVEIPADESVKRRVDHLARYVAADGQQFENAVRMREANNKADYGFLFEPQSSLALYYRWRVYSFAMGDEEYSWRGSPFQMTAEGPISRDRRHFDSRAGRESATVGKDQKLLTGQQLARARDLERGRERNRLSSEDYDDFKELIAALTLERESVKKTMGFALDNSEAAVDLVNIILESFKSSAASGVTLIGLLYVTSDILHNSSAAVKNASLFRTTFQECLPEIMDTLRVAHKNIIGRMSANAMKGKVMNVLNAWESWSLFPPAVLVGLHATFLRKMEEDEYIATHSLTLEGIGEADLERLRKTCRQAGILASGDVKQLGARLHWLKAFTSPTATSAPAPTMAVKKPSTVNNVSADEPKVDTNDTAERKSEKVDEEDRENLDGEPIDEEDLDGDPIDEEPSIECSDDVDGALMDDEALDAEPLDGDVAEDELDGEPLADEDLDGAPMDEDDLDGEPI